MSPERDVAEKKGLLRFIQIGKKIYYPIHCVEEMLQKHLRKM
jgi:hypothetical protein